jgi:hypothetical protein
MRALLLVLLAALPAAAEKKSKRQVIAFFQLGGVVWQAKYYPYKVNGQSCVADQGVLLCGPDLMETDQADFLAWARLIRGPEDWFKRRDAYLGTNVLAGVVFEKGLKAPDFVWYWKDGWERNLYLRIPWPMKAAEFEAWVKGEGRARWSYVAEHHQERVFDPAKRRWHVGQYTYDSLKRKDAPPHSVTETLIVFTARPEEAQPAPPTLKMPQTALKPFETQVDQQERTLQEALKKLVEEKQELKETAIGGADNAFVKQEEKKLDADIDGKSRSLLQTQELLKKFQAEPLYFCSDCE